jgi:hypothetical protein
LGRFLGVVADLVYYDCTIGMAGEQRFNEPLGFGVLGF